MFLVETCVKRHTAGGPPDGEGQWVRWQASQLAPMAPLQRWLWGAGNGSRYRYLKRASPALESSTIKTALADGADMQAQRAQTRRSIGAAAHLDFNRERIRTVRRRRAKTRNIVHVRRDAMLLATIFFRTGSVTAESTRAVALDAVLTAVHLGNIFFVTVSGGGALLMEVRPGIVAGGAVNISADHYVNTLSCFHVPAVGTSYEQGIRAIGVAAYVDLLTIFA
jgi:hypothetical protein